MLMFPNWEGPLLLVHWFGMCEALAVTMGRPCPTWYGLAAAIVFFGPILFMLYCIFKITRMIRRQEIEFIEHDPYPWSDCRAEMNKRGVCGKAKLLYKFYTHKRHKGDWELKDDKGMFWHFLLKDFTGKTWKYCLWILLRKLMLAGTIRSLPVLCVSCSTYLRIGTYLQSLCLPSHFLLISCLSQVQWH